jgi:hypothetical protein
MLSKNFDDSVTIMARIRLAPRRVAFTKLQEAIFGSLQSLADHLTGLTDIHTSLQMALAKAKKGAAEWEGLHPGLACYLGRGLRLLRINDDIMIATALSSSGSIQVFCSQYSTKQWGDLLRQELPELTDEDIEWLCGLTEAMESHEPLAAIVHKDPGRFSQPDSNNNRQTPPQK